MGRERATLWRRAGPERLMPVAARAHRPALPPGDPIRHDRTVDQVPVADRDPDHRLDVEDLGDVVVRASDGRFGSRRDLADVGSDDW